VAASKNKKNNQVKVFVRTLNEESTFRGFMIMAEVGRIRHTFNPM
jgi:hypothetical protein